MPTRMKPSKWSVSRAIAVNTINQPPAPEVTRAEGSLTMKYALVVFDLGHNYRYLNIFDSYSEANEELERIKRLNPSIHLDIITWD